MNNFDNSREWFENESQRMMKITLGTFFGFVLLFVGIFICFRFCCPRIVRRQGVATPVGIPLEQTIHPPPQATYDSLQQFPLQYYPPAPPTQQGQYPPAPPTQQGQYPLAAPTQQGQYPLAPPSPGFVYSPVQQQDPGPVHSSPPLSEFQNQFPTTSPYGAPPVFKY